MVSAICQNYSFSAKPRASTDEKRNNFKFSGNSELAKLCWKVVPVNSFSLGQSKHFIKARKGLLFKDDLLDKFQVAKS